MWELSPAMIHSLYNSIHPPEMEINPLKTACGFPCDGVMKKENKHGQHTLLASYRMHLSMYNCVCVCACVRACVCACVCVCVCVYPPGDPKCVQLENTARTATIIITTQQQQQQQQLVIALAKTQNYSCKPKSVLAYPDHRSGAAP